VRATCGQGSWAINERNWERQGASELCKSEELGRPRSNKDREGGGEGVALLQKATCIERIAPEGTRAAVEEAQFLGETQAPDVAGKVMERRKKSGRPGWGEVYRGNESRD